MKLFARRFACVLAATAASAFQPGPVQAQARSYPAGPVRVIVAFGAGSVTDQLARVLSSGLAERLGQSFVVENKPGANGNIGVGMAVAAPPDGSTLLVGAASTVINQSLYPNLNFKPLTDLVPIANLASVTNVLVVNPQVKARSVKALIAELGTSSYAYASGGVGGTQHLSGELFKSMSGTNMVHVPYKGGAEPLSDLLSGRVQVMFCNLPVCLPHIRSGKLAALAVTSAQRSASLPDVPTVAESGLPGYRVDGWYGLFGPASLPKEIVARLNEETQRILNSPKVRQQLQTMGADPLPGSQQQFADFVQQDFKQWDKLIKDAHITVE